jgi:hypothetical protein
MKKTNNLRATRQYTAWTLIALLSAGLLSACSGVQIERAPTDRFNDAGYQSYSWRDLPIENTGNSDDPLYNIGPSLRSVVNDSLADKGYTLKESGGDFVIHFEFRTALTDGVLPRKMSNIDPVPQVVVNRGTDQAMVDNAYALSGVREMNSILLNFEDRQNQALVWAVSMSKVVENLNRNDPARMRRTLGESVERAFRPLADAK